MNKIKTTKTKNRYLTVSDTGDYARNIIIPSIKLQGIWLSELGFNPKDKVRLVLNDNKIIIEKQ